MKDIRDTVAEAIRKARGQPHPGLRYSQHLANAAIAAYRQACRIETVEQLDALPVGAVIHCGFDGLWLRALNQFDARTWTVLSPPWLLWSPEWRQP